jgi:hypothetical protein
MDFGTKARRKESIEVSGKIILKWIPLQAARVTSSMQFPCIKTRLRTSTTSPLRYMISRRLAVCVEGLTLALGKSWYDPDWSLAGDAELGETDNGASQPSAFILTLSIRNKEEGRRWSIYAPTSSIRCHGNPMLGIPIWLVLRFYVWGTMPLHGIEFLCLRLLVGSPPVWHPTSQVRFWITIQSDGRSDVAYSKSRGSFFSPAYTDFQRITRDRRL